MAPNKLILRKKNENFGKRAKEILYLFYIPYIIYPLIRATTYGKNHATAGTFAFKRELLKETKYDDEAEMAEEKQFLKNYTIPFVQLEAKKAILVFAHDENTFDKRKLLVNPNPNYVKCTKLVVKQFIKDKDMREFYTNQ